MAGPTLSQILDSPRPTTTSRRQDQNPLPSPYSAANSPASLHHPRLGLHHQRSLPPPSPVPGLQPSNTRKLGPAPVTLPPPNAATTATPGINARTSSVPTSSVLQVRPAPTPPAATPPLPTPVSGPLPGPEPTVATVSRSSGDAGYPAAPYAHGRPSIDQAVSPDGSPAATTSNAPANNHRGHNLYACRDCGRSYSRPEHLVRHVQTHTLGRRFVCDICQKSFARKDLLRRHVANHANDSPKKRRRTTAPGTGRVSHACQACASARVKCDDNKPCKRCVTRNLTCVSTEAPSTAAMHLMHLAHSSAGSGPQGEGLPVPADPANASRGSHSPGPLAYSQPRSMPSEAVQDPPLALQHHHPQYPYARHSATPSSAPSRSPQLKLSSHEPSQLPSPAATFVEQGRF